MSDLLESQDIFYPQNFGRLGRKRVFQHPRLITPTILLLANKVGRPSRYRE